MNNHFKLNPVTINDVDSIARIESLVHPDPMDSESLKRCIDNGIQCFKYNIDETIISYAIIQNFAKVFSISRFGVHPKYQRNGYGTQMLNDLIKLCKSYKPEGISLKVRVTNYIAISIYLKSGFKKRSIIPNYYKYTNSDTVTFEDAYFMTLE